MLQFKPHKTHSLVLTPCPIVKQELAKCLFASLLLNYILSPYACSGNTFSFSQWGKLVDGITELSCFPITCQVTRMASGCQCVLFFLFPCFFWVLQEAAPKGTPLRHSCIKWHPRSYDQQGKGRGVFWPDAVFPKHGPGGGGGTGAPPRSRVLGESQLNPLALFYSPHEYHTPMPLRGWSC